MTKRSPYSSLALLLAGLLVSLTVTAAPAHAGLVDKVKSIAPRLASGGLIKAIGDYTDNIREKGTALIKEGLSGTVDAATYNRRVDQFFDKDVQLGVKGFLKDAADNLKLTVANPLAGMKETLGDTRLGQFVSRVQKNIQVTTADGPATDVVKRDEPYGAVDPRIALDVQEEETEWYQAETGLMDDQPLPQAETIAHVHEDSGPQSPDSDWAVYGKGNEKGEPSQPDCENVWVDIDADCGNEDQATAQAQDPWTDLNDGADEWADSSTPDCSGPWVDIDADCGDGNQSEGGRSDQTEVAAASTEAQGGSYQEAVDSLLGEEATPGSDVYSASGESYEGALAQLEAEVAERERLAAEAAERERLARLAEEAERARQAQLAAEAAERERQARLAAAARERLAMEQQRQARANSYDAGGTLLGAIAGGGHKRNGKFRGSRTRDQQCSCGCSRVESRFKRRVCQWPESITECSECPKRNHAEFQKRRVVSVILKLSEPGPGGESGIKGHESCRRGNVSKCPDVYSYPVPCQGTTQSVWMLQWRVRPSHSTSTRNGAGSV